ncbi:site-specific DNA-methyltransferase [Moraxellaceae bacterium AER2_44_116]|nr:site-specific DNA-methyltransferase [Moraxellaceae bacterium]TQC97727.1 site-specific DNA-methyltransferase [Moraxellaceae bacterium AER2_44_116]
MPTLTWVGKDKVVNHHHDVPFRILNKQYNFTANNNSPINSTQNRIIQGDNLEALKSLLPEFEGKVKCIYIDPPYNTGNEGWVYNDNVNDPKMKKWLGQVVGKEGEDLSRHDKWLCMMYPRLKLLHKLLADDGVIFVSIDDNQQANLTLIMDEIFGLKQHVATITLLCNPKGRSQDKYFGTSHEYLIIYSKTERPAESFSIEKNDEAILKDYKLIDEGGRYRLMGLRNSHREFNKQTRPNLFYPLYVNPILKTVNVNQVDGHDIAVLPLWADGFEGCWTWGNSLATQDNHLLVAKQVKGKWEVSRKSYAIKEGEKVRKKLFTIWNDTDFRTEVGQRVFGEIFENSSKLDFPQPKSVALIQEVLRTCTKDNDIILDSFAGSGTTAHAVLKLNAQDGGNRRFILVEMMDYAENITAERVRRVINGYGQDNKAVAGLGGGFDYFTIGEPLFLENDNLNEAVGITAIRDYITYSEGIPIHEQTTPDNPYNPYVLGVNREVAWVFFYETERVTTLDIEFLGTLQFGKHKPVSVIIYADKCLLSPEFMRKHNIRFKKIPRDITRF